jgi:hypothetical protein
MFIVVALAMAMAVVVGGKQDVTHTHTEPNPIHSLTPSLTYSLTHSLTHPPTHSPTHRTSQSTSHSHVIHKRNHTYTRGSHLVHRAPDFRLDCVDFDCAVHVDYPRQLLRVFGTQVKLKLQLNTHAFGRPTRRRA